MATIMKVVLMQDIKKLGKKWDVIEVKAGFFRNYLWPKGMAVIGDASVIAEAEAMQASRLQTVSEMLEKAGEIKETIEGKTLFFARKTNDGGTLYSAVHERDIVDIIKTEHGFEIDDKKIIIEEDIKTIGDHIVKITLSEDVVAEAKIKVEEEK